MDITGAARVIHEARKAYARTLGQDWKPSWYDAPDWEREDMLNTVMFHLENPNATPEEAHQHWAIMKAENKWVLGSGEDPEAREHPLLKPFNELRPEDVKLYKLSRAITEALKDDSNTITRG